MPGFAEELLSRFRWMAVTRTCSASSPTAASSTGVVLVDDWAETGSQALAARALIEECGGTWLGASLLVDQLRDDVRGKLAPVHAVVLSPQLPATPG